jgi:hypothetical protein
MSALVNSPSFELKRYQDPLMIQRALHNAKTIASGLQ